MSKRLNGGELLIDLTPYGSFSDTDKFEDNDVPQKIVDDIKENCVLASDGNIIDIKKPLCIKIIVNDSLVIAQGGVILDDHSALNIYGLNETLLVEISISNAFAIGNTEIRVFEIQMVE